MTEGALFQDLALLMSVAGAVSVVFTRLKWPKVIGYLLSGILLSPHVWGTELFADQQSIATIGQLGIVFLMFALGLEFSPSEMKRIKGVAMPSAIFDVVVMIALGYTVGRKVFGWDTVPALFLGAAICDSATTLLSKTIEEMGWQSRKFVRYIFGTTIGEDILCVGIIAIIVGVAHGSGISVGELGLSMGGLAVFFVAVLVFGLMFVPRLLNYVGRMKDPETLLLTLLGCCFFVSWAAFKLDYSLALGAFLVGIIGACSWVHRRLLELVAPLRSMFSAMFFVSIGILVNPAALAQNWCAILLLILVVVIGKSFNITTMSILAGQGVKDAVQTGLGLAQIGEFAYMVALLYMTETGDFANPMYQIAVGVSLVTTILNPAILKASDPIGDWCEKYMPSRLKGWLAAYHDWLARYRTASVPGPLKRHIRTRLFWMGLLAILHIAVFVAASMLIATDWSSLSQFFDAHKRTFFSFGVNMFCVGALYPIYFLCRSLGRDIGFVLTGGRIAQRDRKNRRWIGAVQQIVSWFLAAGGIMVALLHLVVVNVNLMPDDPVARFVLLVVMAVLGSFGWNRFRQAGRAAGFRFTEALQAEKKRQQETTGIVRKVKTLTVPGDYHQSIDIAAGSIAAGKSIKELDIRARTGASIVAVVRDGEKHRNPGPAWRFAAGDTAMAIGEPEQIDAFRKLVAAR
ncbi:MAG: cation:proton antiporter [Kiritimatiellae bacterium]|nr:cation:proton antiporter [Kiritimatiellia bacterium]